MRNKIAGSMNSIPDFFELNFSFCKYYTPQNPLEEKFTSHSAFRNTVAKNQGVFVALLPDSSKIFAVKFKPGEDEFAFSAFASVCTYQDNYVLLGVDIKKQAFFTPVF